MAKEVERNQPGDIERIIEQLKEAPFEFELAKPTAQRTAEDYETMLGLIMATHLPNTKKRGNEGCSLDDFPSADSLDTLPPTGLDGAYAEEYYLNRQVILDEAVFQNLKEGEERIISPEEERRRDSLDPGKYPYHPRRPGWHGTPYPHNPCDE